jgi:arylsulfatase A-like enzyme
MIARWPGRAAPGSTSEQVLAFWDLLPTFAELAGAAVPSGLDGVSMASALRGDAAREHPPLYWEFHERGFSQAVRMGDWKGVRPKVDSAVELYNLKSDVGEKDNLAAREPAIVRKIEDLMKNLRTESAEFPVAK